MKDLKEIAKKSKQYVYTFFNEKDTSKLLYHDLDHTKETWSFAKDLAKHYEVSDEDYYSLKIATLFHDTGYFIDYNNHEDESVKIAKDFLRGEEVPAEHIDKITGLIISTKHSYKPSTLLEKILHDADYSSIGRKRFFRKAELLRVEWELNLDVKYTDVEWQKKQLLFLQKIQFLTDKNKRR